MAFGDGDGDGDGDWRWGAGNAYDPFPFKKYMISTSNQSHNATNPKQSQINNFR